MSVILKGAPCAAKICAGLAPRIEALKARGVTPKLAIIRVGDREDDKLYEKSAISRCEKNGAEAVSFVFPQNVTETGLKDAITAVNNDPSIHGCLILRPLPGHVNEDAVVNLLAPEKDLDGVTDVSLAGVFSRSGRGFAPCTAEACIELIKHGGYEMNAKKAVVVGRSLVIGKPAAMLLLNENATVTVCHTKTADLAAECRRADIIIAAAGHAHTVTKDCFREGQIVIDVGMNALPDGSFTGDADTADAGEAVEAYSPVPGGVGSVTTSVLLRHLVEAAEKNV